MNGDCEKQDGERAKGRCEGGGRKLAAEATTDPRRAGNARPLALWPVLAWGDVAEIGLLAQPITGAYAQRQSPSVDTAWQGQSFSEPQRRIRVIISAPLHHLRWAIFRTAPANSIAQSSRETEQIASIWHKDVRSHAQKALMCRQYTLGMRLMPAFLVDRLNLLPRYGC